MHGLCVSNDFSWCISDCREASAMKSIVVCEAILDVCAGLSDRASAWMLEPFVITVKFTDEALYTPDAQVDLWTNLAHALMPQCEQHVNTLETACSTGCSINLLAGSDR